MASDETASHGSGNTKQTHMPKARHWQLTLNEIDKYDTLKEYLTGLKSNTYLISCRETAPTTGHQHMHVYVQFSNMISLSIKKCCGAHIEACRGTPQDNVKYIKKDGVIIDEIGECRNWGGMPTTIKDLKAMNKDEVPPALYNVYNKAIHEDDDSMDIDDFHKDIKVFYFYGPSGAGKTTSAIAKAKELGYSKIHIIKYEGNFWSGVGHGHGCAIYDDFRDSHMKPSEFINLIDYNVHTMNVKGSSVQNRFDCVIITSVQSPKSLYRNMWDDEPRKQWLRRMTAIELYNEQDVSDSD